MTTTTAPIEVPTRSLPVELVDGPGGRLYLLPFAPLTADDCEALSVLLAARAAAVRRGESAVPQQSRPGPGLAAAPDQP
jgi:hypothetical protein